MERNNLMSDNLKNHNINGGRTMKDNNINNKVMKDSWKIIRGNYVGETSGGVVGADLFSWPPRSYTCSFCKREFRSAQALGGHMNVHRRDRARLRQSPQINGQDFSTFNLNLDPRQNPNPNPNPSPSPNPNFSSSSTSTAFFRQPFTSNFPTLASPTLSSISNSPSSASPGTEFKKWRRDGALTDQLSPRPNDNITKIKSTKALFGVREFNGLFQGKECEVVKKGEIVRLEIGMLTDSKNDLDLELRLGYS